jgi:hypothetical protein
MKKMIRALVALASFALGSALFAGSQDITLGTGGTIVVTIGGTQDADITIHDLNTNQTVADISALTLGFGWPNNPYSTTYSYGGGTYVPGSALTDVGHSYALITGLPAGNYRITVSSWQLSDFWSTSGGNWAEFDLYDPYNYWSWMDININTQ